MASNEFYTFWFEKNLQGDIVAVYNEYGDKLISYTYDAWGNFSSSWINLAGTNYYATLNPFRYRGYFYDAESGLYYLQSRYYNPQWGRFISADDVSYLLSESQYTNGNLYVYCNNNPVMYTDPSGHFAISTAVIIGAIVGGLIGVGGGLGAVAYFDYKDDGKVNGSKQWYEYVVGATIGGIIGAAAGAAFGYGIGYVCGGTYSNGLVAKSVSNGVRSFTSQANKVHHVLGNAGHKLTGYTEKTMSKLMKNTLKHGVVGPYKSVQSAFWSVKNSEVSFTIVSGIIKISDMWIRR